MSDEHVETVVEDILKTCFCGIIEDDVKATMNWNGISKMIIKEVEQGEFINKRNEMRTEILNKIITKDLDKDIRELTFFQAEMRHRIINKSNQKIGPQYHRNMSPARLQNSLIDNFDELLHWLNKDITDNYVRKLIRKKAIDVANICNFIWLKHLHIEG